MGKAIHEGILRNTKVHISVFVLKVKNIKAT